ncbi:adenylate/guanylate cyclase domain-containing protein, partial [Methylovulum sp.]|uniref:adenylate/guanylate cyclase domain-containing protein n=1 Tax=Methylovulum sp. TaxID=1916980 RepID=UPI00262BA153
VKQFWTNRDSAGDLRTCPDIVFQSYVFKTAYRDIMALLKAINPALAAKYPDSFVQFAGNQAMLDNIGQIQSAFAKFNKDNGQLGQLIAKATFPAKSKHLLSSWLELLHNQKSLYLNHYGNVGTITTIPFYQALEQLQPDILRDKIVMIGFSESIEPEKNLGFYTVFSNAHGQTISPVEIAATAIGNLVDNIWLKPLDPAYQFLLPLVWGIVLSVLCLSCPFHISIGLILLLGSTYLYVAYYEFVTAQVWLPLVVPIGLQMPVILIAASILYFRRNQQAKYKMQLVLRHLLPKEIVDNIPYQPENRVMSTGGKLIQGVCLATDVNDYTKLSESMKPEVLIELMNAYFADIFPLVTDHGGYITDLAGDGMYAVWLNPGHNKQPHINACHAALAIKAAVSQFNQTGQPALITRLGLACGEISIGNTGAPGRYVYRAIGDPVNTASRIEGLNKYLGTHILVTAEVIEGLDGFLLRDLGLFLLKGKSNPVHVFELLMAEIHAVVCARTLTTAFAKALSLFKAKQWTTALAAFVAINNDFPDDGPTQFFIRYLQSLATLPEASLNETANVIDISHITF